MKILLTAINAKYIHSNLAVRSLRAYAQEFRQHIEILEYTINQRTEYLLRELYKKQPDVLMFSCYIWNISQVCQLITELHKLMPNLPIWLGGPEVSFSCEEFLREYPMVTGIMKGEGEETFRQLCRCYVNQDIQFQHIPGIVYRTPEDEIVTTPPREPLEMDTLPFCYEWTEDEKNRMIYYETSRGCPFSCSYCLSSLEKKLRFKSLPLVYQELSFFLEKRVPQVKFTDRTFNCSHGHARAIWQFLLEHDNGVTNFHFEISADLLTEDEIALLKQMRPGLVQLEIGVQSTNEKTIEEICRRMNLAALEEHVRSIQEGKNIHQHLDLIAGLPYEGYISFQKSFDRVYRLHPQQLQLGFLKVLKGSYMHEKQKDYGILYQEMPPYEVMATNWLSYGELLKIKLVEEMLEVYYNSGQYEMTMQILEKSFDSPFLMFLELGEFYEKRDLFSRNHSRISRCEILLEFAGETDAAHKELYEETLTFDLYYRENMKSRPGWAPELSLFKREIRAVCGKNRGVHLEGFFYDFTELLEHRQQGYPKRGKERGFYLFSYDERNPLTGQAKVVYIGKGEEIA